MKYLFLLLISTFIFNVATAQTNAIKITNLNTNKEKIIKENKRIKLRTLDGQKFKGRFRVVNTNTISIDDINIDLADIDALKRNPLFISIIGPSFFIYLGAITVGFSVVAGVFADASALWFVIPGSALLYAGLNSPNFNKNHKRDKGWKFEIVTLTD